MAVKAVDLMLFNWFYVF